jgi:hypothetical protein
VSKIFIVFIELFDMQSIDQCYKHGCLPVPSWKK